MGRIINKSCDRRRLNAFTIVELLVVIVVIGILAAITIVSYSGINNKAVIASIKNDLGGNLRLLKMYQVDHGYYPSSFDSNYCPSSPDVDLKYCLKAMKDAVLSYSGGGQSFVLVDTHSPTGIAYQIDDGGSITAYVPGPWKDVSVGGMHTCAIASDDRLYCWGYNSSGAIGDGTNTNRSIPTLVSQGAMPSNRVKKVTTGNGSTCAIAMNDNVYCWGNNSTHELGDGTTTNRSLPVALLQGSRPTTNAKEVQLYNAHGCLINNDDKVYCWGRNVYSQIGDGTSTERDSPVAVIQGDMPALTVKSLSTADSVANHTCVVGSNDSVYCWGWNAYGQLGNGTLNNTGSPTATSLGARLSLVSKKVSVGGSHTCVIAGDDQLYCFGNGYFGNIGDGTWGNGSSERRLPISVDKGLTPYNSVKSLSTGYFYTCILSDLDAVYCWGAGSDGQLGDGANTYAKTLPGPISMGAMPSAAARKVSANYKHTCVLAYSGDIYCWGDGSYGILGNGGYSQIVIPAKVTVP